MCQRVQVSWQILVHCYDAWNDPRNQVVWNCVMGYYKEKHKNESLSIKLGGPWFELVTIISKTATRYCMTRISTTILITLYVIYLFIETLSTHLPVHR